MLGEDRWLRHMYRQTKLGEDWWLRYMYRQTKLGEGRWLVVVELKWCLWREIIQMK